MPAPTKYLYVSPINISIFALFNSELRINPTNPDLFFTAPFYTYLLRILFARNIRGVQVVMRLVTAEAVIPLAVEGLDNGGFVRLSNRH